MSNWTSNLATSLPIGLVGGVLGYFGMNAIDNSDVSQTDVVAKLQSQVSGFETQLKETQSSVSEQIAAKIAGFEGQMGELQSGFASQLEEQKANLAAIKADAEALASEQGAKLQESLASMNQALASRVDAVESSLNSVSGQAQTALNEGMTAASESLSARIEALEAAYNDLPASLDAKIEEGQQQLAELRAEAESSVLALREEMQQGMSGMASAAAGLTQEAGDKVQAGSEAVRSFLMDNPDFIFMDLLEEFQSNESKYTAQRFAKKLDQGGLRDQLYNNPDDAVMGNPDGDVTIVEFFDYNCGYCKRAAPDLFKVTEDDGDVKLVMKEFPILSDDSRKAARVALAAHLQGEYDAFHRKLITFQGRVTESVALKVAEEVGLDMEQLKTDMDSEAVSKIIQETSLLAHTLGVNGTPAFMVGNTFLPGAVPASEIKKAIAEARASQS